MATAECKHCHLIINDDRGSGWVHSQGAQAGKHTCAAYPYGFHAEPVGEWCTDHPANPCNGAKGIEVVGTEHPIVEQLHTLQMFDAIGHTLTSCVCGPTRTDTFDNAGQVRSTYIHHPLDKPLQYMPIEDWKP